MNTLLSDFAFLYVFKIAGISLAIVFAIDALVAIIVRLVPERKINPFLRLFKASKNERNFYNKIAIKKWKDLIPESGKYLCKFSKSSIEEPNNNEYVLKFLRETCYAGIMHLISIFIGFVPLIFIPQKLTIVFPICFVNAVLQLLPVFVQRYNRIRLINLFDFNKRKEAKNGSN